MSQTLCNDPYRDKLSWMFLLDLFWHITLSFIVKFIFVFLPSFVELIIIILILIVIILIFRILEETYAPHEVKNECWMAQWQQHDYQGSDPGHYPLAFVEAYL